MLGVNQSDFMSYMSALKTNYRKGIHRMEAILANPTHAAEFAANLGGVSVVLGVPVGLPDRNSDKLLELLLGSTVADDAVLTWMHQFYEFTDWDDLMGNAERCKEMANNPLIWRAAGGSKLAVGKSVATLAGLSCADYADIDAVAASQVAMAAIIGNPTALNAVVTSQVAMAAATPLKALQANATAWKTLPERAAQSWVRRLRSLRICDPSGYADMTRLQPLRLLWRPCTLCTYGTPAVCASDVAYNYLLSKATFDTISGQYTRSGWSTRYAKPCIVLKWCYSYNSGTSGIRTCLDGTASRQYTGTQRYNSSMESNTYNDHAEKNGTYYKEFVFCSKLETYNSQSDWPAISIAYFPLP